MNIGIWSREISADTVEELFQKARDYGFTLMQFDFLSVCDEEVPCEYSSELISSIDENAKKYGINIVAVNGTFNMAHPDRAVREDGLRRFEKLAEICKDISCGMITLCTGSRNLESMWVPHPDNDTEEAWKDMTQVMREVIRIADENDVYLGIEPEASNVVNSPERAKRLLEEMDSPRLKIIMDCANLFHKGEAYRENVQRIIGDAFGLLGDYIALAHGKDINEGPGISFTCAGRGIIDFPFFFSELEKIGYKDGMILHGIKNENDIPFCVNVIHEFVKEKE